MKNSEETMKGPLLKEGKLLNNVRGVKDVYE